jgi:hypothetical protein
MVKKVQPYQQQVRYSLQQSMQCDFSSKASNSPRFRFSKCFPLSLGNATQWRPFLPKEGGLIQVDISGHPPIPRAQKTFFHLGIFLAIFRVPNLWDRFEALDDVF